MTSATLNLSYDELKKLYDYFSRPLGGPQPMYEHLWTRIAVMLDNAQTDAYRKHRTYSLRCRSRQAAASYRAVLWS